MWNPGDATPAADKVISCKIGPNWWSQSGYALTFYATGTLPYPYAITGTGYGNVCTQMLIST